MEKEKLLDELREELRIKLRLTELKIRLSLNNLKIKLRLTEEEFNDHEINEFFKRGVILDKIIKTVYYSIIPICENEEDFVKLMMVAIEAYIICQGHLREEILDKISVIDLVACGEKKDKGNFHQKTVTVSSYEDLEKEYKDFEKEASEVFSSWNFMYSVFYEGHFDKYDIREQLEDREE